MRLETWIDPRHLSPGHIAQARTRFESDEFSSVVIDDFLLGERLDGLRACFGGDAEFSDHFGVVHRDALTGRQTSGEKKVDAEVYEAWPDANRLAREQTLSGPAPGRQLSFGWRTYLRWLMFLRSKTFHAYLESITGIGGIVSIDHMPRIMRQGDICRAHSDAGDGRLVCMLLYLDDGWRPGFGGRFQQLRDGMIAESVEPLANRALIHKPATHLVHQVEAFQPLSGDWHRWTHSIWFRG